MPALSLVPIWRLAMRAMSDGALWQSVHMQVLLQGSEASKHSQYFFRHILFRHLHPLLCAG